MGSLRNVIFTEIGPHQEEGAVNFFVFHQSSTSPKIPRRRFSGISMTCARCHNHPLEKWTQRDYYAFANLFSRVQVKQDPDLGKPDAALVVNSASGELVIRARAKC